MKKIISVFIMVFLFLPFSANAYSCIEKHSLYINGEDFEIMNKEFTYDLFAIELYLMDDQTFWYQETKWIHNVPYTNGLELGEYTINDSLVDLKFYPGGNISAYYDTDHNLWLQTDTFTYKMKRCDFFSSDEDFYMNGYVYGK